jgi:hypothetical protein
MGPEFDVIRLNPSADQGQSMAMNTGSLSDPPSPEGGSLGPVAGRRVAECRASLRPAPACGYTLDRLQLVLCRGDTAGHLWLKTLQLQDFR